MELHVIQSLSCIIEVQGDIAVGNAKRDGSFFLLQGNAGKLFYGIRFDKDRLDLHCKKYKLGCKDRICPRFITNLIAILLEQTGVNIKLKPRSQDKSTLDAFCAFGTTLRQYLNRMNIGDLSLTVNSRCGTYAPISSKQLDGLDNESWTEDGWSRFASPDTRKMKLGPVTPNKKPNGSPCEGKSALTPGSCCKKRINESTNFMAESPQEKHTKKDTFYGGSASVGKAAHSPLFPGLRIEKADSSVRRSLGYLPTPVPTKQQHLLTDHFWKDREKQRNTNKDLTGFSNLGNTCYMNAILQALFRLEPFANDLLFTNGSRLQALQENSLYSSLVKLLRVVRKDHLSSTENQKPLLASVKKAISSSARRFSGHQQHDAHEFLCEVFDQLKEEVVSVNKHTPSSSPATRHMHTALVDPARRSFDFEVTHTFRCLDCGRDVQKVEVFNTLSVSLPRVYDEEGGVKKEVKCSIQDALDYYFKSEQLHYVCESCGGRSSEASHKLTKLASVLILHVKRYDCVRAATSKALLQKDDRALLIPTYISLESQCGSNTLPPDTDVHFPKRELYDGSMLSDAASEAKIPVKKRLEYSSANGSPSEVESRASPKMKRTVPATKAADTSSEEETSDVETATQRSLQEASAKPPHGTMEIGGVLMTEDDMMRLAVEQSLMASSGRSYVSGATALHDVSLLHGSRLPRSRGSVARQLGPELASDCESVSSDEIIAATTPPRRVRCQQSKTDMLADHKCHNNSSGCKAELKLLSADEVAAGEDWSDLDNNKENKPPAEEASYPGSGEDSLTLTSSDDCEISDADVEPEDLPIHNRSPKYAERLKTNYETGCMGFCYELVSVVSHLGSSFSSGHYVCDVHDFAHDSWLCCNDTTVTKTASSKVRIRREKSGYIFFYVDKNMAEDLRAYFSVKH